jgi:hypothetical protein
MAPCKEHRTSADAGFDGYSVDISGTSSADSHVLTLMNSFRVLLSLQETASVV